MPSLIAGDSAEGLQVRSNDRGDLAFPTAPDLRILIVGMGQSLGAGSAGVPPLSTTSISPKIEMPDIGELSDIRVGNAPGLQGDAIWPAKAVRIKGFRPAVARAHARTPIWGETPLNGLGNRLFEDVRDELGFEPRVCLWTIAQGGAPYAEVCKGTRPWENGLTILHRLVELTRAEGRRPYMPFVYWRHGEADQGSPHYDKDLLDLHADLQADYKPVLGQSADIPILMAQSSSFSASRAVLAQMRIAELHSDKFILSHPSYGLEHAPDHQHLTAHGYVQDGAFAWRAARAALSAKGWTGFRPVRTKVSRNGATIRIPMLTPTPPMRFLTPPPSPRAGTVNGFVVRRQRTGETLSIAEILIEDPTTIALTLAADPGEPVRVEYALAGYISGIMRIAEDRPRGSLADSAEPPNRAVHFMLVTPS